MVQKPKTHLFEIHILDPKQALEKAAFTVCVAVGNTFWMNITTNISDSLCDFSEKLNVSQLHSDTQQAIIKCTHEESLHKSEGDIFNLCFL